jgi:hypothetical protein
MVDQRLLIKEITRILAPLATAKVTKDPAPADRPNAPMPTAGGYAQPAGLNGGMPQMELASWRAPMELRGTTIHTVGGSMQIPAHGVVNTKNTDDHDEKCDCAGCAVNKELSHRGFRRHQSKKSAAEIVGDDIRAVLRQGAAKSAVIREVIKADPSRQISAAATPNDKAFELWLGKRADAGNPAAAATRWTPREEQRKRLLLQGYSMGEIDKML